MPTATQTPPATEPAMIDTAEVARMLNCSEKHITRLVKAGAMPLGSKLGRLVRWPRKLIVGWIEGGCPPVRPQEVKK
jgi:excisionase family DNA binding protein